MEIPINWIFWFLVLIFAQLANYFAWRGENKDSSLQIVGCILAAFWFSISALFYALGKP